MSREHRSPLHAFLCKQIRYRLLGCLTKSFRSPVHAFGESFPTIGYIEEDDAEPFLLNGRTGYQVSLLSTTQLLSVLLRRKGPTGPAPFYSFFREHLTGLPEEDFKKMLRSPDLHALSAWRTLEQACNRPTSELERRITHLPAGSADIPTRPFRTVQTRDYEFLVFLEDDDTVSASDCFLMRDSRYLTHTR